MADPAFGFDGMNPPPHPLARRRGSPPDGPTSLRSPRSSARGSLALVAGGLEGTVTCVTVPLTACFGFLPNVPRAVRVALAFGGPSARTPLTLPCAPGAQRGAPSAFGATEGHRRGRTSGLRGTEGRGRGTASTADRAKMARASPGGRIHRRRGHVRAGTRGAQHEAEEK